MTNCFWNNTAVFFRNKLRALRVVGSHHGVSLATPRLSVSEHGTVVALNDAFYQTKCALIVDFLLLRFVAINHVEGESSRVVIAALMIQYCNRTQLPVDLYNTLGPYKVRTSLLTHFNFWRVHRSWPDHYFNGFCWFRHSKLLTIKSTLIILNFIHNWPPALMFATLPRYPLLHRVVWHNCGLIIKLNTLLGLLFWSIRALWQGALHLERTLTSPISGTVSVLTALRFNDCCSGLVHNQVHFKLDVRKPVLVLFFWVHNFWVQCCKIAAFLLDLARQVGTQEWNLILYFLDVEFTVFFCELSHNERDFILLFPNVVHFLLQLQDPSLELRIQLNFTACKNVDRLH